ncbi:MAG: SgcJ/EcaC family oxidoreductase [Bryobacteraceae bacterium]|nr:SgcJ/EcaC family oxidoreductase [Bryobacteraceae bacterium]
MLPLLLLALAAGDRESVRAAVESLIAAGNRRDYQAAANAYSEDAVLIPPNAPEIRGRAAILAHYRRVFERDQPRLWVEPEETLVAGDFAVETGRTKGFLWHLGSSADSRKIDDRYVMILRKTDGAWRISRRIWNSQPLADAGPVWVR